MASTNDPQYFEARLTWTGGALGPVRDASYSRDFTAEIPGKPALALSGTVAYRGDPSRHNPEDLLVISLSTCHALTYLALCAKYRIAVVSYEDQAQGELRKADGVVRFTRAVLKPKVTLAPGSDREKALALHADARRHCFIANSVNFEVAHEPEIVAMAG